jgi:hypothetical protein
MDNDSEHKPRMSLKDALETASRQVAESPEWLRDIYKRNDRLLEGQLPRRPTLLPSSS